jgi:dTDP-4-dehydrorhamnose reductase
LAAAAAAVGAPILHLSTDYVFDGRGAGAYVETDPAAPLNVYGASKLAGERAVAAANPAHVILRTAWIYAPQGRNFVRTMLELARTRDEVAVVADQIGAPTYAPDLADGVLAVLAGLAEGRADPWGLFHVSAAGETSWAGFAEAIFSGAAVRGAPSASVRAIATTDHPTPARRPANSRLNNAKLARLHGVVLPHWRDGLERCLDRLLGPRPAAASDRSAPA